ncbi:hypothetical protein L1987_70896 [Smallanthus sonchifolius]|uniref:Uncharacterized protein n=1 Tax=Smallanthus sonchifolius TaxID=185202 RepID=A0ACB9ARS3_9ASTR|nr:hypothetical protein L1987_70896 [Smallanthus sonchifolius]
MTTVVVRMRTAVVVGVVSGPVKGGGELHSGGGRTGLTARMVEAVRVYGGLCDGGSLMVVAVAINNRDGGLHGGSRLLMTYMKKTKLTATIGEHDNDYTMMMMKLLIRADGRMTAYDGRTVMMDGRSFPGRYSITDGRRFAGCCGGRTTTVGRASVFVSYANECCADHPYVYDQ